MARAVDKQIRECFEERYSIRAADVTREVELAVIGGDWGANGFTTMAEADRLGDALDLRPGAILLDIGAGRGWPGLYLAARTGCRVVLVDPPTAGITQALVRAAAEGLTARAVAVCGDGCDLPLRPGSFDAVIHTDVLCCLRPKRAVLVANRRALRPGGRVAFTVIHPAPGLSRAQRRRAARDGPPAVLNARPYEEMLAAAGFVDVGATDCTNEFGRVEAAWLEQYDRHQAALGDLLGQDAFAERQASKRAKLRAIRDGILRRTILTARRPA